MSKDQIATGNALNIHRNRLLSAKLRKIDRDALLNTFQIVEERVAAEREAFKMHLADLRRAAKLRRSQREKEANNNNNNINNNNNNINNNNNNIIHTRPTPPVADSYVGMRRVPLPVKPTGDVLPPVLGRPIHEAGPTFAGVKPIRGFLPNNGGEAITVDTIQKSLVQGRKIDAIKQYRQVFGTGLKESMDAINKAIEVGKLELP